MCHDPAKSGLSAGFLFQNRLLISSRCCSKIRRLSSRTVSIAIAPDIPAHGDSGPPLGLECELPGWRNQLHLRPERNALNFCRSAIAALVRSPWRYCPFRLPGGPPLPLAPPCNRQRPFVVAGDRQGFPLLVRAPHRRARSDVLLSACALVAASAQSSIAALLRATRGTSVAPCTFS